MIKIQQNKDTGIVEEINVSRLEGAEREAEEVQCSSCGATAELCKKGFKIDDNAEVI